MLWRPERASTSMLLFGVVAMMLAGLAYLLAMSYLQQGNARDLLLRGNETLRILRAATEASLDAETGQRGYLLTGNSAYLQPYLEAREVWPRLLDNVEGQDPEFDAERAELLSMLKKLQQAKLEELQHTIRLYQSGNESAAIQEVRQDTGKALMDDYRLISDQYSRLLSAGLAEDRLVVDLGRGKPYLLLAALFLFIMAMLIIGYIIERKRATAELRLEESKELAEAHERMALLARELNHRVNNLFSVVLAIVSLASREHDNKDEMVRDVRERIHALSRAHSIARGDPDQAAISLDRLIATILEPYIEDGEQRVKLPESAIELQARAITPLGLIFHELATNAAKYGALSTDQGQLAINAEEVLHDDGTRSALVCWSEHRIRVNVTKEGFGTTMMQAAAKQLHGNVDVELKPDSIQITLSFPLSV